MAEALEDQEGTLRITDSTITNLYFRDEIDALDRTSIADGKYISTQESKVMTNNTNGIDIDTGKKLVHIF
jgi:hypothetical protein